MIFASTGTLSQPFNRLMNALLLFFNNKANHPVIIQSGNYIPKKPTSPHISLIPFISFDQTIKYYQQAKLIISAAGEASVYLILKHAQNKPIFFPRLKKHHEHVDNLQLATCLYLKNNQLAHVYLNQKTLSTNLPKILNNSQKNKQPFKSNPNQKIKLIKNLNHFLDTK